MGVREMSSILRQRPTATASTGQVCKAVTCCHAPPLGQDDPFPFGIGFYVLFRPSVSRLCTEKGTRSTAYFFLGFLR